MLSLRDQLDEALAIPNIASREEIEEALPQASRELVDAIVELARPAQGAPTLTMNVPAFITSLKGITVSAFATVGNYTRVKDSELIKPKKNGISGRITKLAVSQVVVNANYANMVTNRMGKLCEPGETIEEHFGMDRFEAQPRTWGERVFVDGKPVGLVEHLGEFYLETAKIRNIGKVYYFWDGQPIEWDAIKANFHPKRASKTQPLPTDMQVQWRTWKMESIKTVSITPNTNPRICHRFALAL